MASTLRYKQDIAMEMEAIIQAWGAGQLPIGWGGDGNQTFPGQQDIDKPYLLDQLQKIASDFSTASSRARIRLQGLISSVPPYGNERVIRRLMYVVSIQNRDAAISEINTVIQEINSGALALNDTEHYPYPGGYGGGYGGYYGGTTPGYGTYPG